MKPISTFFNLRATLKSFAFFLAVVCSTNAYGQSTTTYHHMQFTPGYGLSDDVIVEDTFDLAPTPSNPTQPLISPAVWADSTFTKWYPPAPPTQVTKAFLFTAESMYNITGAQASSSGGPMYGSFPTSRLITSHQFGNGGPDYMMEPYDQNNALRLEGSYVIDTLKFTNTTLTGDIFVLGTVSGGNQPVFFNVLYTDSTSQSHYILFPNYVNDPDYAMEVGMIQNSTPWLQESGVPTDSGPRIYDRRLKLPAAHYGKQIEGITITKTGNTVLNIFAVTIADNDCLPVETIYTPTFSNITVTSANISWSAVTGTQGYAYHLIESPTNLTAIAPQGAGGFFAQSGVSSSASLNLTGLTPNTQYILYVSSLCSSTDSSIWNSVTFHTPKCKQPPPYSIGYNTTGNPIGFKTTTSLDIKWYKFMSEVPQSPNVVTWEYGITPDPVLPPTVLYTSTTPFDTSHNFTGLLTDQQYCFWIRNYCTSGPYYSDWQKNCVFKTDPCPPVYYIHLDSSTHMPGTARFWWNVVNDGAVVGYEYALMPTTGTPSPSDWVKTTDTFVHFTNLNPGQQYRLYVRTDCNNVTASFKALFPYQNPYYDCFAPGNPVISNININGAQIDWTQGGSAAPYPLLGYNISVSPSSMPPYSDSSTAFDYLGSPISKFFYRADTFAHPWQLVPNTKYYVHVRTYCDSVQTPGQVAYLQHKYSTPEYAWEVDTFRTPATCQAPVIPTISNLTPNTADFLWNPYYGTDGYEYYIDEYATAPPANKVAYITYHQLNALNLFSNTNYWLHLRTICDYSQTDTSLRHSPWTHTPFQTPALCSSAVPTPSFVSNTGVTANFSWTPTGSGNGYDVAVTSSINPPGTPDATVTFTTYKALSLTPNTSYYFHVRSRCSPNDLSAWATIPFTTNATSIETFNNNLAVVVYPNPVSDELIVDIQNNPNGTLQVFDITGKLMHTVKTTTQKTGINMKHYAAGIYLVKYLVDGQTLQTIRVEKI